jgi:hypothetical protein
MGLLCNPAGASSLATGSMFGIRLENRFSDSPENA